VSIQTASRLTALSERSVRRLVRPGELRIRKIGAGRIISFGSLKNLVS